MPNRNPNKSNHVIIRIKLPISLVQNSMRAIALLLLTVIVRSAPPMMKPIDVGPPSPTVQSS